MESKRNLIPLPSKDLVDLKRDVKSLKDSNLRTELKINELGQSFTEVKRQILFFKEEILGEIKDTRKDFQWHSSPHLWLGS